MLVRLVRLVRRSPSWQAAIVQTTSLLSLLLLYSFLRFADRYDYLGVNHRYILLFYFSSSTYHGRSEALVIFYGLYIYTIYGAGATLTFAKGLIGFLLPGAVVFFLLLFFDQQQKADALLFSYLASKLRCHWLSPNMC